MKKPDTHEIERAFQEWLNSTPGAETLTDSLKRVALINFTLDYLEESKRKVKEVHTLTEEVRFKVYDKIATICGNVNRNAYQFCGCWCYATNGDVVTTNGASMIVMKCMEAERKAELVRNGYTGAEESFTYPKYKNIVDQGCDDCFHTATIFLDHILRIPNLPQKAKKQEFYLGFSHGGETVHYDVAQLISFRKIANALGRKKDIEFNVQFGRRKSPSVWTLGKSNVTCYLMPLSKVEREQEKVIMMLNV